MRETADKKRCVVISGMENKPHPKRIVREETELVMEIKSVLEVKENIDKEIEEI